MQTTFREPYHPFSMPTLADKPYKLKVLERQDGLVRMLALFKSFVEFLLRAHLLKTHTQKLH